MRQSEKNENAVNSTTLVTEICEINKKEIKTLTFIGYRILTSLDFPILFSPFFP